MTSKMINMLNLDTLLARTDDEFTLDIKIVLKMGTYRNLDEVPLL